MVYSRGTNGSGSYWTKKPPAIEASAGQVRADVPFYEDFAYTVREEVRTGFGDAMARAMATRRR
jgi:hypothetical protein